LSNGGLANLTFIYDQMNIPCPFAKTIHLPCHDIEHVKYSTYSSRTLQSSYQYLVWADSPYDDLHAIGENLPSIRLKKYPQEYMNEETTKAICISILNPNKGHLRALLASFLYEGSLYNFPKELIHIVLDYVRYPGCSYPQHFDIYL